MRKPVKPLFDAPSGKHWSKRLPMEQRRNIVLKSHKGNYYNSWKAMDYLSKGTHDKKTKELSRADANYFYRMYNKGK